MDNKIIREFITFLKEHNAYEKFRKNNADPNFCGILNKKSDFSWFDLKCANEAPRLWLDRAFEWVGTREGASYWYDLHKQWDMYCAQKRYPQ